MQNLGSMFSNIRKRIASGGRKQGILTNTGAKMIQTQTASFSPWAGDIYNDDISRAVIWSFAEIASKAQFIHVRGEGKDLRVNPDADIRLLLEQPNEYLTMQDVIAKAAVHYEKYNNAFILIVRGANGRPSMLYPIDYASVRLEEGAGHQIFCRFRIRGGKEITAPYADVIHLRKHFDDDDFFGNDNKKSLSGIMEVVTTSDQGIVSAIKNSAIINWIMKFRTTIRPDDMKAQVKEFSETYLSTAENGTGVAASDPKYDVEQINHQSYVPNAQLTDRAKARMYAYYGSNEAIVTGTYDENTYNAYYEKRVEPFLMRLAQQMTFKFFNTSDRAHHNRILPQASSMIYSSNTTKLNFVQLVDRGAMTPNQWAEMFNLPPVEGGDVPIRRLDTAAVDNNHSQPVANLKEPEKPKEESTVDGKDNNNAHQRSAIQRADRHDWIFEMRASENEGENKYIVEGRAISYESPTLMYEMDGIKYFEVIKRGALDGTDMSDVPMRYNHSSNYMIVGRHNERRPNRSTVDFFIDQNGLNIRADLSKTESARQLYEAIKAELISQMSFAFSVESEEYNRETHTRSILKIKKLWDVSAVDTPAYDTTSIYARDRFIAEAENEKRQAEAADARKRSAVAAELDILLTLAQNKN